MAFTRDTEAQVNVCANNFSYSHNLYSLHFQSNIPDCSRIIDHTYSAFSRYLKGLGLPNQSLPK